MIWIKRKLKKYERMRLEQSYTPLPQHKAKHTFTGTLQWH